MGAACPNVGTRERDGEKKGGEGGKGYIRKRIIRSGIKQERSHSSRWNSGAESWEELNSESLSCPVGLLGQVYGSVLVIWPVSRVRQGRLISSLFLKWGFGSSMITEGRWRFLLDTGSHCLSDPESIQVRESSFSFL